MGGKFFVPVRVVYEYAMSWTNGVTSLVMFSLPECLAYTDRLVAYRPCARGL